MSTTNKNIVYAEKDVLPDVPFNPKDVKVRISIMVDGDILEAYKKEAEQLHTKYQTLMQQKLRDGISSSVSEGKVSANEFNDLVKRMNILEDAFLNTSRQRKPAKVMRKLRPKKVRSKRDAG